MSPHNIALVAAGVPLPMATTYETAVRLVMLADFSIVDAMPLVWPCPPCEAVTLPIG